IVGLGWAKQLVLTGERIDATRAERIGLVTRVVPRAQLEQAVRLQARALASMPAVGLRYAKQGLDQGLDLSFASALVAERDAEVACFATEEFQANLRAFAARKRSSAGERRS